MLVLNESEIFLDYLISSRESAGGYSCKCRHLNGRTLQLNKPHDTQAGAIAYCRTAILADTLSRSTFPQLLVRLDTGNRIVMANKAAQKLFGGTMAGCSYGWFLPFGREALERDGEGRRDAFGFTLDGRHLRLKVAERLVKVAGISFVLATINSANC